MRTSPQAARALAVARIPGDDPAWRAAMSAPFDDTPDTEQERADLEEAQAEGRFVSNAEVRRSLDAKTSR